MEIRCIFSVPVLVRVKSRCSKFVSFSRSVQTCEVNFHFPYFFKVPKEIPVLSCAFSDIDLQSSKHTRREL
jgi:hypothetical protein